MLSYGRIIQLPVAFPLHPYAYPLQFILASSPRNVNVAWVIVKRITIPLKAGTTTTTTTTTTSWLDRANFPPAAFLRVIPSLSLSLSLFLVDC